MDRFEEDDDDGLDYVFLGDSGVVSLGEMSRRGDKIRENERRDRQTVARLLKNSELFRRRAEIRNGLRNWFEKIPCLADLLEYPYLKKMSAQEVFDEHMSIVERKTARAKLVQDGYVAGTLRVLEEDDNPEKDESTLRREEFAKRTAYKFGWYFSYTGPGEAMNYLNWILPGIKDNSLRNEVTEMVALKAAEMLSGLIKRKDGDAAADLFFRFGRIHKFEREDFFDVKENEMKDPAIKKAFLKALSRTVAADPGLSAYKTARDHMEEVGFFAGKEADASGEVSKAVNELLDKAMDRHAIVYREVLKSVNGMGLQTGIEDEGVRQRKALIPRLVKMMSKSPELYAVIRDRWAKWGIVDVAATDGDRGVLTAFDEYLHTCFEKNPYFYNKLKFLWCGFGLVESKSADVGHVTSVNWTIKVKFGEDPDADKLVADFQNERMKGQSLIRDEDEEENNCMRRFRLFYKAKKEEFEEKYPQYAELDGRDGEDEGEEGVHRQNNVEWRR